MAEPYLRFRGVEAMIGVWRVLPLSAIVTLVGK